MALITVLLVVAVLTAIVSRLTLSNQVWVRQAETGLAAAQADQARRAAQQWVRLILARDDNAYDARTDVWARPLPPMPVRWGELDGQINDAQGRLNVNNLVTPKGEVNQTALERFRRLLRLLELDPGIADAAVDWIDPDGAPRGRGAEDGFYAGRRQPYLAANRPFGSAAELRLVRGVDAETWRTLKPHVAALPQATGVNVNTATPEVLAAAVTRWGPPLNAIARGQRWARRTNAQPFADLEAFLRAAIGEDTEGSPEGLTVGSQYFMGHTRLTFGTVERRTATLYHRSQGMARIVRHRRKLR